MLWCLTRRGWSLSAEIFFYLMFPLLIPMIRGRSRTSLLAGLGIVLGLSLIAPIICFYLNIQWFGRVPAFDLVGDQTAPNIAQFNPLLRLPDFIFGIIVACLFQQRASMPDQKHQGWKWYVPGMVGIFVICSELSSYIPHPMLNSALLIFFGMLIYGLADGGGPIECALSHNWLVKLGEASYAMYILHAPLVWWTYYIDGRGPNLLLTHPMVVFVIYLVVLIGLSLAVYACVEEPARKYLRSKLNGKPAYGITPMHPEQALAG